MNKLTQKQEAFCIAYIEAGNASEAYRRAYNAVKMKPGSIHQKAWELLQKVEITARLKVLRTPAIDKAQITLENHLERLEHLSRLAEEAKQYGAAIKAEEQRGKAAGLYTERRELSGLGGEALMPSVIKLVSPTE